MSLFDKLKEPVILKDNSSALEQLNYLQSLYPNTNLEGQILIKQNMKYLNYGINGENTILFELKNSHMPMYILHDVCFEKNGLNAQIDFLVFTRKFLFIIECKNLFGNIEINNNGDFIRIVDVNNKTKKEGIYSPITQNERHLQLLKSLNIVRKNSILSSNNFDEYAKSIVVLANPKTILNAKYAKKEVKDNVIRADQLIKHIKDIYKNSNESALSDNSLKAWANSYLQYTKSNNTNYIKNYDKYLLSNVITDNSKPLNVNNSDIFNDLKAYRLNKSREENIKPYFIYNDSQLNELISIMPKNIEELVNVSGFSKVKATKYGFDIINILKKYID